MKKQGWCQCCAPTLMHSTPRTHQPKVLEVVVIGELLASSHIPQREDAHTDLQAHIGSMLSSRQLGLRSR